MRSNVVSRRMGSSSVQTWLAALLSRETIYIFAFGRTAVIINGGSLHDLDEQMGPLNKLGPLRYGVGLAPPGTQNNQFTLTAAVCRVRMPFLNEIPSRVRPRTSDSYLQRNDLPQMKTGRKLLVTHNGATNQFSDSFCLPQ